MQIFRTNLYRALFGIFATLSSTAGAHSSTNWRLDKEAYRSYRPGRRQPARAFPSRSRLLDIEIDPAVLRAKLSEFSGLTPTVINGQSVLISERSSLAGRELARKFLERELGALGLQVSRQTYARGANVLAETGSTNGPLYILSAHFDSVGNAGANDDGIGNMAALAILQALAPLRLNGRIRFVGFDQEEVGLVGSAEYVKDLVARGEKVSGVFHVEMMGFNGRRDGQFHVIDCDRPESVILKEHVSEAIRGTRLRISKACTDRSDHSNFWKANIPAVVISENFFGGDSDPCYHRRCDVVDDRLDFSYAAEIASSLARALATLLNAR